MRKEREGGKGGEKDGLIERRKRKEMRKKRRERKIERDRGR